VFVPSSDDTAKVEGENKVKEEDEPVGVECVLQIQSRTMIDEGADLPNNSMEVPKRN